MNFRQTDFCKKLLSLIFNTALFVQNAHGKIFTLEVENFSNNAMRMSRSAASGNSSVWFKTGQHVQMEICLRVASFVSVRNVVYSNDGESDSIRATIDNQHMGTFQTGSLRESGNGWNIFRSSGPMEGKVRLEQGRHVIDIRAVSTDEWGVELDNIVFLIDDELLTQEDLQCNLYCFDVKYDDVPRMDAIPSGRFVQKSRATQCSEQDNIKVDIYHDTAEDFDIIATMPKYTSFANNRDPDYAKCVLASPFWSFHNLSVEPTTPPVYYSNVSVSFSGSLNMTLVDINFHFRDITPTREIDERYVGSRLKVRLRNMPLENVRVKPEYWKDQRWVELHEFEFTPFANENSWAIPERAWGIIGENRIRVMIHPGKQQVILETLKLESNMPSDSTVDLYADADVVFQGVRLGFWHHRTQHPDSMRVTVQDGRVPAEYANIDSVRVYAKVPWTGGYAQVFVLFQDGRSRLQAITPHGLDWLPFGPSINIGQPEAPDSDRPYSPIKQISIDPNLRQLVLRYENDNKATLAIETTYMATTLKVRNIGFKKARKDFPIMTFQSMWIMDGNADTDHVTFNGDISRHIFSQWNELYGIWAVFFRKCISSHNTQGPDITIKFQAKSDI
ncbi:hypothetical protein DPMN_024862 [Dreissena polymorpha]|uniref:Uncharacterized protein n=1 Tax=Dreissena polymorpha TaxID=45954 RepID=A0A9D4LNQ4_DREPO|nr:hypothetical protein DPMN_024862 [Dreissena polymorpha]